jgi:hypothetical protein
MVFNTSTFLNHCRIELLDGFLPSASAVIAFLRFSTDNKGLSILNVRPTLPGSINVTFQGVDATMLGDESLPESLPGVYHDNVDEFS